MVDISEKSITNIQLLLSGFASLIIISIGMYFLSIANSLTLFLGSLGWTIGFFLVSFGFAFLFYVVNMYNSFKAEENNLIINRKLDQIKEKMGLTKTIPLIFKYKKQNNKLEKCIFLKRIIVLLICIGFVLVIVLFWSFLSIVDIQVGSRCSENPATCCTVNINNPNSINYTYINYTFTNSSSTNYQVNNYNQTNGSISTLQNSPTVRTSNPFFIIGGFLLVIFSLISAFNSKWYANVLKTRNLLKEEDINEAEFWINVLFVMFVIVIISLFDLAGEINYWPNADHLTNWLMVIATFFVLYVTITYAKSVKEQTQFIKEQVNISHNQFESQTRPWVHVYLARKKETPFLPNMIWVVIENTGFSPAKEIQFIPEPDKETSTGILSTRYEVFNKGIDYLGPHQKISFIFADTARDTEYQNEGFVFNLNVKYKDQSDKQYENNRYPVEPYRYWGGRFLPLFED